MRFQFGLCLAGLLAGVGPLAVSCSDSGSSGAPATIDAGDSSAAGGSGGTADATAVGGAGGTGGIVTGGSGGLDAGGDACVPNCTGRQCGPDPVCGTSCGACQVNEICGKTGQCACVPDCVGKTCGPDGCNGSCGQCPSGATCSASGTCECTPDAGLVCCDQGVIATGRKVATTRDPASVDACATKGGIFAFPEVTRGFRPWLGSGAASVRSRWHRS